MGLVLPTAACGSRSAFAAFVPRRRLKRVESPFHRSQPWGGAGSEHKSRCIIHSGLCYSPQFIIPHVKQCLRLPKYGELEGLPATASPAAFLFAEGAS